VLNPIIGVEERILAGIETAMKEAAHICQLVARQRNDRVRKLYMFTARCKILACKAKYRRRLVDDDARLRPKD
jgi:ligand-binding sensor protein